MEINDFYKVYIIESLSKGDLQTGKKYEGKILSEILALQEIPVSYLPVNDKVNFAEAVERIRKDVVSQRRELQDKGSFSFPILHLSCHGNKDGIELTNEFIKWNELCTMLLVLNDAFIEIDVDVNPLLLVMSVCEGLYAVTLDVIAQQISEKSPFAFLIANNKKIFWEDTIVAFPVLYYNLILKSAEWDKSVEMMNKSIDMYSDYFQFIPSIELSNAFKSL